MTRRASCAGAALLAGVGIAVACGEVPTLPGRVAYITPILLPSPTVAYGDTLRDSLGRAAPLQVYAIGRASGDTIRAVTRRFVLTSLNTGAFIGAEGFLVVPESLQTLRVVAQVTDAAGGTALQLQTPEITIDVVPRADSLARLPTAVDSSQPLPPVSPLSVSVSGVGPRGRGPVAGIRVRYRIEAIYPGTVPATGHYYLADRNTTVLRPDSTIALDTTSASGVASRFFVAPAIAAGEVNADSVLVLARALSQRGVELAGSPVRFVVRIRR